ncbi:MAG: DsbA family protein [Pseudobdellovibrionaceae bacterium]|nr:DsbA family protein [Pseudobdellovibrionaceae bacterium]
MTFIQSTSSKFALVTAAWALMGGAFGVTPSYAADKTSFTEAQKAELEDFVRDFIMNNPEVLIDSVNKMRENQQKAQEEDAQKSIEKYKEHLFEDKLIPEIGNPKGDITVVEFFDFNCGYCKRAFDTVNEAVQNDKNLRVRFIDLPILSPQSETAAKWAMAAHKQGKYWEFHSALMKNPAPKTEENLEDMAKDLGLDVARMKKDAEGEDIKKELEKNREVANALAVTGTPGFVIGKQIIRGYAEYEAFKAIIEDERKAK